MQRTSKLDATIGRRSDGHRRVAIGVALSLVVACSILAAGPANGQVVPLQDVVPLDELETTTDDLVRLATSYADAIREFKTAKLTADTLTVLRPSALITNLEIQIARVNVDAGEAKVFVLRKIAEKQLAAAEVKLEILKRLDSMTPQTEAAAAGVSGSRLRIAQAEATIAILKAILAFK